MKSERRVRSGTPPQAEYERERARCTMVCTPRSHDARVDKYDKLRVIVRESLSQGGGENVDDPVKSAFHARKMHARANKHGKSSCTRARRMDAPFTYTHCS